MSERFKMTIEPIAVSPAEAAALLGVSRSTVYEMMGRVDFPKFKEGARCLITVRELREWAADQVERQKGAAPVLEHRSGRAEQSLTEPVSASSIHGNRRVSQV